MADRGGRRVLSRAVRDAEVLRIDALWLCTKPVDMRCGAERLLAHVVHALGSANAHHSYVFANARATRIKMLVHDGFSVWCAARLLNVGRFVWPREIDASRPIALTQAQFDALVVGLAPAPGQVAVAATLELTAQQFEALVVGLPWQRLGKLSVISRS